MNHIQIFINLATDSVMKNSDLNTIDIQKRIDELQSELLALKNKLTEHTSLVIAPHEFQEVIDKVSLKVIDWYSSMRTESERGSTYLNNDRIITLRAKSISFDFIQAFHRIYEDGLAPEGKKLGLSILYDLGYILGKQDARIYRETMNPENFLEHVAAGPMHFALSGWAKVEFLKDSIPEKSEDFVLRYIHHNSFEADGWKQEGIQSDTPICSWNIGYSAGWCEECIGIPLSAAELSCTACGDDHCYFIMAPTTRIHQVIEEERNKMNLSRPFLLPDHFEIKVFHEKLIENDYLLDEALKLAKIGIWKFIPKKSRLFWSKELYRIFQITDTLHNENLLEYYYSCLTQQDLLELQRLTDRLLESGEQYNFTHKIILPDGKTKWLECTGQPIHGDDGSIIGVSGVVKEITEEVREIRDLDIFFNLSVDLQCIASDSGYFLKVSPSWSKLLGYSTQELTTQPFTNFVHPDDLEATYNEMGKLNHGALSVNFENRYLTKDGKVVIIGWNSTKDPINQLYYCSARDVTAERQKRDELISDLSEKDMLLREIHHRVKNNLQIISSLLSLQSGQKHVNKKLSKLYLDSQSRIKSMAAIHELFYQSENLNHIDFSHYIHKLVRDLLHTFKGERHDVQLKIDVQRVFLNLDTAVPLGLIMNEIITNSLKHGLTELTDGLIEITLSEQGNGYFHLLIGDNGKGMETPINIEESDSLGLTIISSLVEQLDGHYKLQSSNLGTFYDITFKTQR